MTLSSLVINRAELLARLIAAFRKNPKTERALALEIGISQNTLRRFMNDHPRMALIQLCKIEDWVIKVEKGGV